MSRNQETFQNESKSNLNELLFVSHEKKSRCKGTSKTKTN